LKRSLFILLLFISFVLSSFSQNLKNEELNFKSWLYYKVILNKTLTNFSVQDIELAELILSVKVDTCIKVKSNKIISGQVLQYKQIGKGKRDVKIYVCKINNKGKIKSIVNTTKSDINGSFSIEYKFKTTKMGLFFIKDNEASILITPIKTFK